jgi:formamidopyrimidine-DNA glycosylase
MPELAEVEYYRRQWDGGVGQAVTRVHLHGGKRVMRGTDLALLRSIAGRKLVSSEAAGKQMLFRFEKGLWLGVHLGMTGKLAAAAPEFEPGKHDHLVLYQRARALVFTDARQFGRVLAHHGDQPPAWWAKIPPAVISRAFSPQKMSAFLDRRSRVAVKAALLDQAGFPGIGNWMADEILWRAGLAPERRCAELGLEERKRLWRETRLVARVALEKIGRDFGDPPRGWLFHERWGQGGVCPRHKTELRRETIGGRTTAWCPQCQR